MNKISVIIPIYNVEKYLSECVDSVINQTYKNIEIILVDDGSPDNCPKICDEYAKRDERIKVIHKKNGGLSSARNAGLNVITGDYCVFLDSDDYWCDCNFLKKIVEEKLINKPDLVIFGYTKNKAIIFNYKRDIQFEKSINQAEKNQTLKQLVVNDKLQSSAVNKIFSVKLIKNNDLKFIENIYSEDIDWTARLMIAAENICYYDVCFYFYRENQTSITHNLAEKNLCDLADQIKRIVEYADDICEKDYYEWYMNYCAYQYITFLNCIVTIEKSANMEKLKREMKFYTYLLDYHINKKVSLVYKFNKIFGYNVMLKILKVFLTIRRKA